MKRIDPKSVTIGLLSGVCIMLLMGQAKKKEEAPINKILRAEKLEIVKDGKVYITLKAEYHEDTLKKPGFEFEPYSEGQINIEGQIKIEGNLTLVKSLEDDFSSVQNNLSSSTISMMDVDSGKFSVIQPGKPFSFLHVGNTMSGVHDVIKTKKLLIINDKGDRVGDFSNMGSELGDGGFFSIWDSKGKAVVSAMSIESAKTPAYGTILLDCDGKNRLILSGAGDDNHGAYVLLYNKTGEGVVQLDADEYGNGVVGAFNRKGKGRTLKPGP